MGWLTDIYSENVKVGKHGMQIMYGIRGEKDLTETTLDDLSGYEGAKPVRIGNAAFDQRQNDVYGALLDSVYIHAKVQDHLPHELWDGALPAGRDRDLGLGEARPGHLGGAGRAEALRLLEADVLGRPRPRLPAGRPDRRRGPARPVGRRSPSRSGLTSSDRGVSDRGVFRQHYDTDGARRLDPPDPPGPLPATGRRASRQDRQGDPRGAHRGRSRPPLPGRPDRRRPARARRPPSPICSFWLASALSEIGESDAAREMCERLLNYARAARPLRRGARPQDRPPLGQLPPGLHPPGADQRREPRDQRRPRRRATAIGQAVLTEMISSQTD